MASIDIASAKEFRVFRGLDDDEARPFTEAARVVVLAAGEALFHQGERGEALFFLAAGRVEVVAGEEGASEQLATLEAGSIVGEGAVLIDAPRNASVVAVTDARLWEISRGAFRAALASGHRWASVLLLAIAEVQAERLGAVDSRLLTMIAAARTTDPELGESKMPELERLRRRLLTDWSF